MSSSTTETREIILLKHPRQSPLEAMDCCDHCQDTKDLFDEEKAKTELRKYRKNGPPNKCTELLIEGLKTLDLEGKALLDVGGGVGMIPLELLPEGIAESTLVEASRPYLTVAKQEAWRRGFGVQTSYEHGDFVDLAPELPDADLVTLDRVFCCYPDMERLARASTAKASRWYGVTYPKPRWYGTVIEKLAGVYCWARDMAFRMHVHSGIEETIREQGFEPFYQVETILWRVELYERTGACTRNGVS